MFAKSKEIATSYIHLLVFNFEQITPHEAMVSMKEAKSRYDKAMELNTSVVEGTHKSSDLTLKLKVYLLSLWRVIS